MIILDDSGVEVTTRACSIVASHFPLTAIANVRRVTV